MIASSGEQDSAGIYTNIKQSETYRISFFLTKEYLIVTMKCSPKKITMGHCSVFPYGAPRPNYRTHVTLKKRCNVCLRVSFPMLTLCSCFCEIWNPLSCTHEIHPIPSLEESFELKSATIDLSSFGAKDGNSMRQSTQVNACRNL